MTDTEKTHKTVGVMWNLWHGCHKKSPGCKNCYVFSGDKKRNLDANIDFKKGILRNNGN